MGAFAYTIFQNLVASAICAAPALIHLHRKLDRHHRELLGQPPRERGAR